MPSGTLHLKPSPAKGKKASDASQQAINQVNLMWGSNVDAKEDRLPLRRHQRKQAAAITEKTAPAKGAPRNKSNKRKRASEEVAPPAPSGSRSSPQKKPTVHEGDFAVVVPPAQPADLIKKKSRTASDASKDEAGPTLRVLPYQAPEAVGKGKGKGSTSKAQPFSDKSQSKRGPKASITDAASASSSTPDSSSSPEPELQPLTNKGRSTRFSANKEADPPAPSGALVLTNVKPPSSPSKPAPKIQLESSDEQVSSDEGRGKASSSSSSSDSSSQDSDQSDESSTHSDAEGLVEAEEEEQWNNFLSSSGLSPFAADANIVNDGSRCPFCNGPMPPLPSHELLTMIEVLQAEAKKSRRKGDRANRLPAARVAPVCQRHRDEIEVIPEGHEKGYPKAGEIKFKKIYRRMESFVQRLDKVAWDHKDTTFRQKAFEDWEQKKLSSRSNAIDEIGTFDVEVPGYYGMLGFQTILGHLREMYADLPADRHEPLPKDFFIRRVLLPETGLQLIQQDFQVDRGPASEIMAESRRYGQAVHSPMEDLFTKQEMRQIKRDKAEDKSKKLKALTAPAAAAGSSQQEPSPLSSPSMKNHRLRSSVGGMNT